MRKVLVLSPNFPPTDAVDMHRVRMTIGRYGENGWAPSVLAARPEDTGMLIDPALAAVLPTDLPVERVAAPRRLWTSALGLNAIGLRAFGAFERAGAALLAREHFDLVFISTTSFPLMNLGARWRARFGVPFVLDFQDPWATWPASAKAHFRRGPRHALMRLIHRRLERRTVPFAAGLMATSQAYIDLLRAAYPVITTRPGLVSPFGWSSRDFEIAAVRGRVLPEISTAKQQGARVLLFAGRVAPTMAGALRALFEAVARGGPQQAVKLVFVGTGYMGQGEQLASQLAREVGIGDLVVESPKRVPLMDALASMLASDGVLVLGSDDQAYTPSKLNQALSRALPVVCAAPAGNALITQTQGLAGVTVVAAGATSAPLNLAEILGAGVSGLDMSERMARAAASEAAACAMRDCALFDQAIR